MRWVTTEPNTYQKFIRTLVPFLLLVGLTLAVKADNLLDPIGKDEGSFLYVGQEWLRGKRGRCPMNGVLKSYLSAVGCWPNTGS